MRAIFSILGLLLAVMIIGFLARKQLGSTQQVAPAPAVSGTESTTIQPGGNARQQSEQIQKQYKEALDQAMQARPDPDKQDQ